MNNCYQVVDISQNEPCENFISCMRLKLMEIGFVGGQDIEIQKKQFGLYVVNMLSKQGHVEQTIALREEEFSKICLKEKN